MAVDDLVAECAEVDLDDVAAREQRVGEELKGLRERLMKAREVQADARREFEAIGGSDRVARATADRQAASSEMTDSCWHALLKVHQMDRKRGDDQDD